MCAGTQKPGQGLATLGQKTAEPSAVGGRCTCEKAASVRCVGGCPGRPGRLVLRRTRQHQAAPGSTTTVSSASESEKVILFFHATWCSTCKLLASDIEANAASIPAGVKILKVDYDSETALKQKYGVTLQHTLVQVKPDGSQIAKWSLSRDLNALVKEIR
ncbi:UNVERIFIED_ORG: thiol-disulfide isomerase/thioredoxin [Arthrobacter sp. UYEF2]